MGINAVKLRGLAEKYGMTIPELLRTMINEYNKTEKVVKTEKVPINQLIKLYEEYKEKSSPKQPGKKSWDLDESEKLKIQEKSLGTSDEMIQQDDFFEFVKKYTANFENLMTDRLIINGMGKRGRFPKVSINDMDKYSKFQEFIERLKDFPQLPEKELLKAALNSGKYDKIETRILKARLEVIEGEKQIRQ